MFQRNLSADTRPEQCITISTQLLALDAGVYQLNEGESLRAFSIRRSSTSNCVLQLGLVLGLTFLTWNTHLIVPALAEEEGTRFCQGFLYCKETKGDTSYTQAFLYLYSTEERGTYSRLTVRPFYSRELDPARNYLRQSVLWPLGISELKGDASYFQILPFYWHADDPTGQYTVVIPVYFDYAKGDRRYTHFLPLYGHHQRGDYYHRYFVLGPLAIATYDNQTNLKEWDVLFPLFHYDADLNSSSTRLFPIYFSGENRQDGSWYRHLFPLYGRSVTPQTDLSYLFPLYGSFTDTATQELRTSAIGLPPLPRVHLPALALYEHVWTPTSVSDRLFPLYRYAHADTDNLSELDFMVLFQSRTGPTLTAHRLFPLYYYENDRALDHTVWSLLGYDQFALAGYGQDHDRAWQQFIPLYRTTEDLTTQTHNTYALGIGPLSLFRYWNTPVGLGHRLFPIYSYDRPNDEEWHWSALISGPISLYRHDHKGTATHDRFFPLYDWTHNGESRSFSLLGVSEFAMFRQENGPVHFAQRLFPLYGYSSSHHTSQLSLVGFPPREETFAWSLYEQGSSPSYFLTRLFPLYRFERNDETKEVNWSALLLYRHVESETRLLDMFPPLHEYERDDRTGTTELNLVGLKPITLFKHGTAPDARSSYLFPLYDYDRKGTASRLSLIGWPKIGILPTLSLFEREDTPSVVAHRFFPLYRYRRNDEAKTRDWDVVLLWWHRQTESHLRDIFLPLTDIEEDSGTNSRRVSLVGLPRVGGLPALTLFNWEQTPSLNTHRFFPVYHYSYDQTQDATTWNALWLYWHHSEPGQIRDMLFPLGSVRQNLNEQMWNVSALGVEPLSLIAISKSPTSVQHRFSPLWEYHEGGNNWGLALIGFQQLSLFSHETTAGSTTDHLFPLWWHIKSPTESTNVIIPLWSDLENRETRERKLGVLGVGPLSLYYQHESPAGMTQRLFPVWSFQYEEATQEGRTGVLGIPPLSLYYRYTSPTTTENRLFPFFRYTSDRIKDESEFWFLWPLFDHKTVQGRTTETSFLWWLFEYRSPKADEWEYWVFGHPPIAMYMRTVSPTKTLVEINPVIPGWRREYVEGIGTSWALFGGLIGMDAMPDGTHKLRLFWALQL